MNLRCSHPDCTAEWSLATSVRASDFRKEVVDGSDVSPEMAAWLADTAPRLARDDGWGVMFDGAVVCSAHNRPEGGFPTYTVTCKHAGCEASFTETRYRAAETAEEADYSASVVAIHSHGWSMATGKALRCPEHSVVAGRIVLHGFVANPCTSDAIELGVGRLALPPELSDTARSMRGERVRIIIEREGDEP